MIALFENGMLVALCDCTRIAHEFIRDNPAIYTQRNVDSLATLANMLPIEQQRYQTVCLSLRSVESEMYKLLYS